MQKLTELIISKRECLVGTDSLGNKYYESSDNKKKRYIIYKGQVRPEAIPPLWHAWLHCLTDQLPLSDTSPVQSKALDTITDIDQYSFEDEKLSTSIYTRWQPK